MLKKLKLIINYLTKHWVITLTVSLLLAAALSSLLSIGQNIWFDEGYSIYVAQKPFHEIVNLVSVDAHPPFYFLLLKLWGSLFSWNEFALRFLSIIFATGSIAITFFIIKKIAGTKIALGVLPFLILAPFALRYSYEIRPYAMTSALVTGGTLVLLYASEAKKRSMWIWYSIIVASGMFTLYMSALVWIGHVAWLAFNSWRNKKATPVKVWFSSYVLAVIFFLPWLPTFINQFLNSALPGIGQPFSTAVGAETMSHLMLYQQSWQTRELFVMFLIILIVSLIFLSARIWDKSNAKTRNNLIFIGCLTIVPFAVLFVLNAFSSNPFYVSRYLAHFAIFYYMAIGFIISSSFKFTPKLSLVSGSIALVILIAGVINLSINGNFNFERNQKPAVTNAVNNIECNNNKTFLAQDEYTYIDSWFYLKDCNLKFLQEKDVSTHGGYAPLHNSPEQIRNINEMKTPQLIFISWKDTDNSKIFSNSDFKLVQKNIYEQHQIEIYQRNVNEE